MFAAVVVGLAFSISAACGSNADSTNASGSQPPFLVVSDPCSLSQETLNRFPGKISATNVADVTASFIASADRNAPGFKGCYYAPQGSEPEASSTAVGLARYPATMQASAQGASVYQSIASGASLKGAQALGTATTLPRTRMLVESTDSGGGIYRVQGACKIGTDYWLISYSGVGTGKAQDEAAMDSLGADMGCQPVGPS